MKAVLGALVVVLAGLCQATPSVQHRVDSEAKVKEYLRRYGHDNRAPTPGALTRVGDLRRTDDFAEAVRSFQRFADLPVTGILDDETFAMMNTPRCGVKDVENGKSLTKRKKRYAPEGSRWGRTKLKYKINSYSQDLPADQQRVIFSRAFKVWSDVTPLSFEQSSNTKVDIDIKFAKGAHGDGNSFDGKGGTLAHAFFPQYGGDAHFDDDEFFTDGKQFGTNLFQVAAHEFGHSLGLGHSQHRDALMAPFYRGYVPNLKLHADDIAGIKILYGGMTPSKPTTSPALPTGPKLCDNVKFDAIFTDARFGTFAFSGNQFYKLTRSAVEDGYPRKIRDTFTRNDKVDAAFTKQLRYSRSQSSFSAIFLFEGYRVIGYRLQDKKVVYDSRSEATSAGLFSGLRLPIDAIFRWSRNGRIYAMRGDQYYRLNDEDLSVAQADPPYPRQLAVWGLPLRRVDAVLRYENGRTYFFSGGEYYRYDDIHLKPDQNYPKEVAHWWLGCTQGSLQEDTKREETDVAIEDSQFINIKTVFQLEVEGNGADSKLNFKSGFLVALASALVTGHFLNMNSFSNE